MDDTSVGHTYMVYYHLVGKLKVAALNCSSFTRE